MIEYMNNRIKYFLINGPLQFWIYKESISDISNEIFQILQSITTNS